MRDEDDIPSRAVSETEAAKILGVARITLRKWRERESGDSRGCGPNYHKYGRNVRYDIADLILYKRRHLVRRELDDMAAA